jgi:hypothetical protein
MDMYRHPQVPGTYFPALHSLSVAIVEWQLRCSDSLPLSRSTAAWTLQVCDTYVVIGGLPRVRACQQCFGQHPLDGGNGNGYRWATRMSAYGRKVLEGLGGKRAVDSHLTICTLGFGPRAGQGIQLPSLTNVNRSLRPPYGEGSKRPLLRLSPQQLQALTNESALWSLRFYSALNHEKRKPDTR